MNNNQQGWIKSICKLSALVMVVIFFTSCTKQIAFQGSSVVPAARGTVKVSKDNNENYDISIFIRNLAEPGRLSPARNTYVVWMETRENATLNIGQINSSTNFLSNKLKASFSTVSSSRPTKIFLTAEDDGNVQNPGTSVVMATGSF